MSVPTKKISDLFTDVKIGGTPSRGNPAYFNGDNLWVSIRDMEGQPLITKTAEAISDEGARNSNCKLVKKGSLLFSFKLTVGRIAFAGADLYTNEAIAAFDRDEAEMAGVDLEYLSLVLPIAARGDSTKNSMGAALLNKDKILNLEIPVLEIDDQRQIAARLKAQLAEVEIARQAAQAQLRDAVLLRRSLLESAFAHVLDRFDRGVCLADVCTISAGGTPSRGTTAFFRGPIPWVKTLDLNFGLVMDTEEKISLEAFRAIRGELLPVGTVLVAMYGGAGTIGKSGILGIEACTNQAVCALQPKAEILDSEFLHEWICFVRPEWMRLAGGNRKDPNINKSVVENMTLPLPPLDDQQHIVARLKQQLADADALRAALEQQLRDLDALPQRILAKAFEN